MNAVTVDPVLQKLRWAVEDPSQPSSDFDLNRDAFRADDRVLRPAAVLIALQKIDGDWRVWLTKRSAQLRHHPGQIAFPGGKQDVEDHGPEGAALREAQEEIGLDPMNVEVLGRLSGHDTITAFHVTPLVAIIKAPFTPIAEAGEVAEVFHVPLTHVMDPMKFRIEGRVWQGQMRRFYTVPFGPYYIWGATARILFGLAQKVGS